MPTIAHVNVPPPKSWDEFEDILLSTAKLRWSTTDFFRHGRSGQNQQGVDIFGRDSEGRRLGIQAKNTMRSIAKNIILDEIARAEAFKPPIEALYFGTTAKRDAELQKLVRNVSESRRTDSRFSVGILFWDDIIQDLARDEREFFKHYPQLRPVSGVHPSEAETLQLLLKTGEDIIRRQRIMTTSDDWENDPSIGVRTEEGALWREAVRRHIREKHAQSPVILRELEDLLDIQKHIFDDKFNRAQGTRAGFIESYLNHSYRIQSFLQKYG